MSDDLEPLYLSLIESDDLLRVLLQTPSLPDSLGPLLQRLQVRQDNNQTLDTATGSETLAQGNSVLYTYTI